MLRKVIYKYKRFGVFELIKVLKSALIYYLVNYCLNRDYIIRKIHGYKLKLDLADSGISRQLVIDGTREEQLRYVLKEEIGKGMTILDIGANIGYYPLMEAKLVGDYGLIYAVEPAPDNYKQLIKNIELNGLSHLFKTYNMGISNKKGKERFYLSTHSNLHTFIKEGFKDKYITKGVTENCIEVEVTDLSSFLEDNKHLEFIRMDVEGYEVEIIDGLEKAIKSGLFKGKIIFECHFPKYDNEKHNIRKPIEMLFENNYRVKTMTSNDEKVSKIKDFGYKADMLIRTGDTVFQGIYRNISNADAINLISNFGGVRDVLLVKE